MATDRTNAPEISDFGILRIQPPQTVSSSGIEIKIIENGDEDVCMLTILFPSGEMEASSPEMMKLLTSAWREGTNNFSSDEIADKLDFYGAWMEISASTHYTNITLYCLTSRLPDLLPLLRDIIKNPVFSNDTLDKIRSKLISALRISNDKVKVLARDIMRCQILGSDHPAARKESEEGFENVSSEEIKSQHNLIISSKPSLVLAGKLTEHVIDAVKGFALSIGKDCYSTNTRNVVLPSPEQGKRIAVERRPEKEQSAIIMSFPSITRNHPDYNFLRITVMLLGGYFGSRLMSNIREEKGYTYGISASLVGNNEIGYVVIECECDNSNVLNVISETKNELIRLAETPVSDEELNTVKRMIRSSLASMQSDTFETAGYYIGQITIGYQEDYFNAQQRALEEITPEQIMALASKYLNPDNMFIAVSGGFCGDIAK